MYSVNDIWFFIICVPTFGYLRIYRLFAAPRSFSQLVTSFFGSWCQGIPLMLFLAWTPCFVLFLLELLCITFYSCLFRSGKIIFYPFFGKTWFLHHFFFPLINSYKLIIAFFKSVRVLKFFLFGFQWTYAAFACVSFGSSSELPKAAGYPAS